MANEWVAVWAVPLLNGKGTGWRYVQFPGWKKRRGMYRNRRVVGSVQTTLTYDIDKAYRFRSPSEGKRRLANRSLHPQASGLWSKREMDRVMFVKVGPREAK